MKFNIIVQGKPVPKGSASAFYNKAIGRAMVVQSNANKQKPWVSAIVDKAKQEWGQRPPTRGRVSISKMEFSFFRPKSHFGSGKNSNVVKSSSPSCHLSKPDIDKLIRCDLDALTGIIWVDDSQVVAIDNAEKTWGEKEGLSMSLEAECASDSESTEETGTTK